LPAIQVIARIERNLHVRPFEYHEAAERVGVEHPAVRRNVSYEDLAHRGDSQSTGEDEIPAADRQGQGGQADGERCQLRRIFRAQVLPFGHHA